MFFVHVCMHADAIPRSGKYIRSTYFCQYFWWLELDLLHEYLDIFSPIFSVRLPQKINHLHFEFTIREPNELDHIEPPPPPPTTAGCLEHQRPR